MVYPRRLARWRRHLPRAAAINDVRELAPVGRPHVAGLDPGARRLRPVLEPGGLPAPRRRPAARGLFLI